MGTYIIAKSSSVRRIVGGNSPGVQVAGRQPFTVIRGGAALEPLIAARRDRPGLCPKTRIAKLRGADALDAFDRYRGILLAFAEGSISWCEVVASIGRVNRPHAIVGVGWRS